METQKLRLESNYTDYYDVMFNREAEHSLVRIAREKSTFDVATGFAVFGRNNVTHVNWWYTKDEEMFREKITTPNVLVSVDGELIKHTKDSAIKNFPNALAMELYDDAPHIRWVQHQLGGMSYWVEVKEVSEGRFERTLMDFELITSPMVSKYIVYSVHYQLSEAKGGIAAYRFNRTPLFRNTPIYHEVRPKVAIEEIKKVYFGRSEDDGDGNNNNNEKSRGGDAGRILKLSDARGGDCGTDGDCSEGAGECSCDGGGSTETPST